VKNEAPTGTPGVQGRAVRDNIRYDVGYDDLVYGVHTAIGHDDFEENFACSSIRRIMSHMTAMFVVEVGG
jgi:hypothetical protein